MFWLEILSCEGQAQEQAVLKNYLSNTRAEPLQNSVTYLLVCAGHRGTLDASPLSQSPHGSEKPVSEQTCRTEVLNSSPHVAERQELLFWSITVRAHFNSCTY